MNRLVIISIVCLLFACKGKKDVARTQATTATAAPTWVDQRPLDPFSYIGIGLGRKDRGDHLEVAKKNALNDMASEIKVKVEGNSLLYTLDRTTEFAEEFTSSIQTSTSEELEGYELVDTWENGSEYWTYYRLSKSEHDRLKAARKLQAMDQAKDLYLRSKKSRMEGDLRTALDMDLRALMAIRDYWAEENRTDLEGKEVFFANELFNDLQGLFANVKLSVLPERCELSLQNDFQREMLIQATGKWYGSVVSLRQLPLIVEYQSAKGLVSERKSTDADGYLRVRVQNVAIPAGRSMRVRIASDQLITNDYESAFTRPLLKNVPKAEALVPIDLVLPKVFLRADERNLGVVLKDGGLSSVLREEMIRSGFRFVTNTSQADLLLDLRASTEKGDTAIWFLTAFLNMRVVLSDARTGEVMSDVAEQRIKGAQLTYPKAGMAAYEKARQLMKKDIVPQMITAIL